MARLPPPRRLDQSPRSEKPEQPAVVGDLPEQSGRRKRRSELAQAPAEAAPVVPAAAPPPADETPRDHYSYDEIMERLRTSVETRKGPRRSQQPVVQTRRWRRRLIIASVVTAVLALGIWQGFRLLESLRIEGETFRSELNRRTTELLGMQVEYGRFSRGAGSDDLATATAHVENRRSELFRSADLNRLSCVLTRSSWYSPDWSLKLLNIGEATLNFSPVDPPAGDTNSWVAMDERQRPERKDFRFTLSSDPDNVAVETVRFSKLHLNWPGSGGKPESITRLAGTLTPGAAGLAFDLHDGELQLTGFSPMEVGKLAGRLDGEKLTIHSARVAISPEAELRLTGSADFRPDGGIELQGELPEVSARNLLPSAWQKRVLGRLELSDIIWKSSFRSGPPPRFSGKFTLHGASLLNLPFLERLAKLLRLRPGQLLVPFEVESISGRFSWTPAGCELTGISGQVGATLRLHGNVTLGAAGDVTGALTIELSPAAIFSGGGRIPADFRRLPDNWQAVDIALSGTAEEIADSMAGMEPADIAPPDENKSGAIVPAPRTEDKNDAELEKKFQDILKGEGKE